MQGVHHHIAPRAVSPVIQITAGRSVEYYPDGHTRKSYADQEYYEVPAHAARDMVKRGWARLASPDPREPPDEPPPPPPPQPTPQPAPQQPPPVKEPGQDDDNDGDDNDGREEEARSLRAKKRR